jgi:hypothetical protein
MMSLSRDVEQVIIKFADGGSKVFSGKAYYMQRPNEAQAKHGNAHFHEMDERTGKWVEHEVWWRE